MAKYKDALIALNISYVIQCVDLLTVKKIKQQLALLKYFTISLLVFA